VIDLTAAFWAFTLGYLLVTPFLVFLRGRVLAFAAGGTVVALAAILVEGVVQGLAGPLYGPAFVLVMFAPLTEELLKFGVSGATGQDYRSAAGVGAGFTASENAVYFLAAWGEPTASLVALIAVRALTDPLLHITASTMATLTWRGRPYGLPLAVLLHMGWNSTTLMLAFLQPAPAVLLLLAAGLTVLGILVWLRRQPSLRSALRPRVHRDLPWAAFEVET
jgi:hypothetical protein